MHVDQDSAGVRIPPPFALLLCLLVGYALQGLFPLRLFPSLLCWILGPLFLVGGIGGILYCAGMFKKRGINIKPWKSTSGLMTSGIYGFSRNPIYLFFLMTLAGFAFALNSLWILLMILPLLVFLDRYVIAREEKYLESKFGVEYRAYQARVRRWI